MNLKRIKKIKQDSRFVFQALKDIARTPLPALARPDFNTNPSTYKGTWLGHATFLIDWQGLWFITDPVLNTRLGPGGLGPKRYQYPSLAIDELPAIDFALISHAHVDHLDTWTLSRLKGIKTIFTATGTTDLISPHFKGDIVEVLPETTVEVTHLDKTVSISGMAVNHQNGRFRKDTHRQCVGFIIEDDLKRVVFIGDTAWDERYLDSPIEHADLSLLPIGGYQPFQHRHCTPEEAVKMAQCFGSKRMFPHQFDTFKLSFEPLSEPRERYRQAMASQNTMTYCGDEQGIIFDF